MVLANQPDWSALDSFPSDHGLRAYSHKDGGPWLLECWRLSRRGDPYPFQGAPSDNFRSPFLAGDAADLAAAIEAIRQVLGRVTAYGTGYVHAALDVSHRLGQTVYFFAADDDVQDTALLATSPGPITMGAWYGSCRFTFESGGASIIPVQFDEDEEAPLDAVQLSRLRSIPGLTVAPTVAAEGGKRLYDYPLRLWPPSLPDPERLLGLGTWDPFLQFEDHFSLAYGRPAVS